MTRLYTPFYPAHLSNYTKGRGGKSIKKITFHHTAAPNSTLRFLWQNPARNGSSHYFVGVGTNKYEQYVKEADTAWTNGNFASNQESITIETRGDWRFGYTSQETINNLIELVRDIRNAHPGIGYNIHRDVSAKGTVCPGDLPVALVWAASDPTPRAAQPKPVATLRVDIPDKKVVLIRDTNIWDMSFTSFRNAKAVGSLKKGTVIDVAGAYDHPLSKTDYYLSNWSWSKNLNNGISKADCTDYIAPAPVVVPIHTAPVDDPAKLPENEGPQGGQGISPPLPVDPNGDRITALENIVNGILVFLRSIFKNFKG